MGNATSQEHRPTISAGYVSVRPIFQIALAAAVAGVIAFLCQPYRPVIVRGRSMNPTFHDGQLVFSIPLERAPRDGDVILLEKDGATIIKRVSMAPGDCYQEAYEPRMHEWIRVITPAMKRLVRTGRLAGRTTQVPEGELYITGDNPQVSLDSRQFGFVPTSSIRGLVVPPNT